MPIAQQSEKQQNHIFHASLIQFESEIKFVKKENGESPF